MRVLVILACCAMAACTQLPPRPAQVPFEHALAVAQDSHLDQLFAPLERQHAGQSAFRLVDDGYEAFALRLYSSRIAERSIDVQTYIWHVDLTGGYLAHALLQAADRGVKVRLLVDDMDARQKHYAFAALDAHPNISVRLFNPFASRSGMLGKLGEVGRRFSEINRRMHNKTWIVDNRLAFAGGRNLGNEYFGASEHANFVDLDMAMAGPVVRDASASFDRYWNADVTYPIALLAPADVNRGALNRVREELGKHALAAPTSHYAQVLRQDELVHNLVAGQWRMRWIDDYRFISDDPLKVRDQETGPHSQVLQGLLGIAELSQQDMLVISPYFVPGPVGMQAIEDLRQRGCQVRVVTNSLAANDVVAVHSGYQKYREPMLAAGVELWELKPQFKKRVRASLFGSSGASLHSKALVADGDLVFVGSYNLDRRSGNLNTEQGVLVRDREIGQHMRELFAQQANGARAWQVSLEDEQLVWRDDEGSYETEPETGVGRRMLTWLIGLLPIEKQL